MCPVKSNRDAFRLIQKNTLLPRSSTSPGFSCIWHGLRISDNAFVLQELLRVDRTHDIKIAPCRIHVQDLFDNKYFKYIITQVLGRSYYFTLST